MFALWNRNNIFAAEVLILIKRENYEKREQ
jgi:hypothetical protein